MKILFNSFTLFILFLSSCQPNKKEPHKTTGTDSSQITSTKNNQAAVDSITVSGITENKICFENKGLKYTVSITLIITGNKASGSVSSEEIGNNRLGGNGEIQKVPFKGRISGDSIFVTFKGTPPVAGSASEWTELPWRLQNNRSAGKAMQILVIPFQARNYDTNQWELTEYFFEEIGCQK